MCRYRAESSSKQIGTALLRGLFPLGQEVFRKVVKAMDKAIPSPFGWEQQHSVAGPLKEYVIALEPELDR
jgi:hypothetical protein